MIPPWKEIIWLSWSVTKPAFSVIWERAGHEKLIYLRVDGGSWLPLIQQLQYDIHPMLHTFLREGGGREGGGRGGGGEGRRGRGGKEGEGREGGGGEGRRGRGGGEGGGGEGREGGGGEGRRGRGGEEGGGGEKRRKGRRYGGWMPGCGREE